MLATALAPRWLRSPECARVLQALDRGDTLILPAVISGGLVALFFAAIAQQVGALVIVSELFDTVTTRERVYA